MNFEWKLYIDLAYELINYQRSRSLAEAYLRSSVSRSYYGAFCTARDRKGLKHLKGARVHFTVITRYKNSANPVEKESGRILDELRRLRNKADYSTVIEVGRDVAGRAHIMARQVIESLHSL